MIKITADSTCDLPANVLEQYNISIAPLHVFVGDDDYKDGVTINTTDLFRYVEEQDKPCKTAAVNVYEYEQFFEPLAKEYTAVIHINLGSGFSSCYQNARIAALDFDNVYIVDSGNLCSGSGHLVLDAALMAREQMEPEEIVRRLHETIPYVEASFVIDKMDYLYKGGRCSGVEAIGASLLRIKPSIEVRDGKMRVGPKYRGKFERCLREYVRDKLENTPDIDTSRLFITNCMCTPETVELVKEWVAQYVQFDEIIFNKAGCTIACHCGPNTLGIMFKRKVETQVS